MTPNTTATNVAPMAIGMMDRLLGQAVQALQEDLTNTDPHHEKGIILEIEAGKGAHLDLALENAIVVADQAVC